MNFATLVLHLAPVCAAEDRLGGHQIDVGLLTDFPVMVGGNATYETPWRLRAELNAGWIPEPYVDTINWGMTTFDVYSENVANLIEVALQNSLVLRAEVGYRPLPERGLTVSAGYQHLGLAGDTVDVEVFTDNIEGDLADFAQGATGDLEVSISDHMLTGEVGYEWAIKERLVLRSTLGFAYSLSSKTDIEPTHDASTSIGETAMDALEITGEDYLDFIFEEWVHLPMLGVNAAWRFR